MRLNITLPDDLKNSLEKVENKSNYIAQALREKILRDKKQKLHAELREGYASYNGKNPIEKEWDSAINDGEWDEY